MKNYIIYTHSQIFFNVKWKEMRLVETCRQRECANKCTKFQSEIVEERDSLEDIGVN
jgi:hypothetical protein